MAGQSQRKNVFLEKKEGLTPRSWVDIALTSDGTKDLKKLDLSVFKFPKPVELIKHFLLIATKEDDLILDFFRRFLYDSASRLRTQP